MRTSFLWGIVAALAVMGTGAGPAAADVLFYDDFESGLGQWTPKTSFSAAGIVPDPANPGNQVLSFGTRNTAGDIFSDPIPVPKNEDLTLSFDYLGLEDPIGGGLVGINDGSLDGTTPPTEWIAGFEGNGSYPEVMADDGEWHSYSVPFNTGDNDQIGIVLEDWQGSPGNNAFFDDVAVNTIPEPSSTALVVGALTAAALLFRRRRAV